MQFLKKTLCLSVICAGFLCISGCGKTELPSAEEVYADILSQSGGRETKDEILIPGKDGENMIVSGGAEINISHKEDGYIVFCYNGDADKVVLQITQPDGSRYPYPIKPGNEDILNLVSGDGDYKIDVLEHKGDNMYTTALSETINVSGMDEFLPFLYPNQYTDYDTESECVGLAKEISEHSDTDLTFVSNVYNYVISAIDYDMELAENIGTNYIPDPDATLESKKGICFDYASLMTSMLRSQGVPTKLEVGYAGTAYHAWISVYLKETGWVDNIIEFDGKNWSFMDPTVAANNADDKEMKKLIGDGTSYMVQYHY